MVSSKEEENKESTVSSRRLFTKQSIPQRRKNMFLSNSREIQSFMSSLSYWVSYPLSHIEQEYIIGGMKPQPILVFLLGFAVCSVPLDYCMLQTGEKTYRSRGALYQHGIIIDDVKERDFITIRHQRICGIVT